MRELGKDLQDSRKPDPVLVEQLREQVIWEELDVIRRESDGRFRGIYVLPSFHSIWDWHGVICVRSGLYQYGVFKFQVRVPAKYPMEEPRVSFSPQCIPFHPFVDPKTGRVDFRYVLMQEDNPSGAWDPHAKKHRMHTLIYSLKKIFYPNGLDPRIKDQHGDPQVKPFQLFNPNFQSSGPGAQTLREATLNDEATKILTKNCMWWKSNGPRVDQLEKKLKVSICPHPAPAQVWHAARQEDAKAAAELEKLQGEAQAAELNFRARVERSVNESQDRLKYNHADFCLRVRNDVEDEWEGPTPSDPLEGAGNVVRIKELLELAGLSADVSEEGE